MGQKQSSKKQNKQNMNTPHPPQWSAISAEQLPVLTVAPVKQGCQLRACIICDSFGQFH